MCKNSFADVDKTKSNLARQKICVCCVPHLGNIIGAVFGYGLAGSPYWSLKLGFDSAKSLVNKIIHIKSLCLLIFDVMIDGMHSSSNT